jgi:protocatechuate 3,4-dioxygenase beta subunit
VAALAGITTVIAVPAAAQTTGVLTGTVSDPSGAPVADAVVAIVSSAGVSVATLRTSPAGEYRSEGLDPGSYRIRVQRDGFNPLDSGPYEVSARASNIRGSSRGKCNGRADPLASWEARTTSA